MNQSKKAVYVEVTICGTVLTDETEDQNAVNYVNHTYDPANLHHFELEFFNNNDLNPLIIGTNYKIKCIESMDHDSI